MHSQGVQTKIRFALLPRRCALSGRIIWLQKAHYFYEVYYSITGDIVVYSSWVHKHEYLKWMLQN